MNRAAMEQRRSEFIAMGVPAREATVALTHSLTDDERAAWLEIPAEELRESADFRRGILRARGDSVAEYDLPKHPSKQEP